MRLLVIGGCHTYGFGVDFERGFVQQVASMLSRVGTEATIDYYAPAKLSGLVPVLRQLADQLHTYDLILLQPAHFELIHTRFRHLFEPVAVNPLTAANTRCPLTIGQPARPMAVHLSHRNLYKADQEQVDAQAPANGWRDRLRNVIKKSIIKWAHRRGRVTRLNYIAQTMAEVLDELHFVRERVILVSPMPVRDPFVRQLRWLVRDEFLRQAERADVAVVDSFAAVCSPDSALLPDGCHLNNRGHTQLAEAVLATCRRAGFIRSSRRVTEPLLV